jgi:Tfp pilus assembly protein PilO
MSTTFHKSSWIVTPCLGAIATAYLMFMWMPSRQAIKEWRDQVEAKQQFLAQSTNLSAMLAAAQQELDKSQTVTTAWEKTAPGKRDIPALYGRVNALAKDAGLAITRFDPQSFTAYEKFQEIPIAIAGSGSFTQVFQFLRLVEGLPVTIWVESMRLEKAAQGASQNAKNVQCELSLVIFSNNQQNSDYARHAD